MYICMYEFVGQNERGDQQRGVMSGVERRVYVFCFCFVCCMFHPISYYRRHITRSIKSLYIYIYMHMYLYLSMYAFVLFFQLSVCVISGLLKFWPATDSAKEILFLNELEDLLDLTQREQFEVLIPILFKRLALSVSSPHFQVAERSLFFWQNEHVNELIAQNIDRIFPIMASALHGKHWNPTVNNLTVEVLKTFIDLDSTLVESYRGSNDEDAVEAQRTAARTAWSSLEAQHATALVSLEESKTS